jgi:hypothetical protein
VLVAAAVVVWQRFMWLDGSCRLHHQVLQAATGMVVVGLALKAVRMLLIGPQ